MTVAKRAGYRRFVATWAVLTGLALLLIAAFNVVIDPFEAYGLGLFPGLGPYKLKRGSRTAKAELLHRSRCETLILGSSRGEVGIDPAYEGWGTGHVVNVSLAATNFVETYAAFELAVREHPELERVVFFADFSMFNGMRGYNSDFKLSRFNPDLDRPQYWLQQLLSNYALKASIDVLEKASQDRPGKLGDRGAWRRDLDPARVHKRPQRALVEAVLSAFLRNKLKHGYEYDAERMALFEAMVKTCRARGLNLIVVISPMHAIHLEGMYAGGLQASFEQWKRDTARILAEQTPSGGEPYPLFDLAVYGAYQTEAVPEAGVRGTYMKWYWESSHFNMNLGDRIIDGITGRTDLDPELGARVTADGMEAHLDAQRRARQVYVGGHPDEAAWILDVAAAVAAEAAEEGWSGGEEDENGEAGE